MKAFSKAPITIDFETEGIGKRPDHYPPKPVGVAIWDVGKAPMYLAWGHPSKNNSTLEEAKSKLCQVWNSGRALLFHNAPFDVEVAIKWFGLKHPSWNMVHDTQIMAFLYNPHSKKLDLKELAIDFLNMLPSEQDELRDWILVNVSEARKAKTKWGAYICKAPGDLVGKYAKGDVIRTRKIYDLLKSKIALAAYNREREVQPALLRATQKGVPIAKTKLQEDLVKYEKTLIIVDQDIRKLLGVPNLDVDSPKQLAKAIGDKNLITDWIKTPKGGRSVSAKALSISCKDQNLVGLMGYRARLKTGIRTFGSSWLDVAYDSRLHFKWNQTLGTDAGAIYGARTGRLSSSPNAQNLPKNRPTQTLKKYPPLPHPREYITPEKTQVLLGRDYSQQELRILAWYLGGPTTAAYIKNPRLDLHEYAKQEIKNRYGVDLPRGDFKTLAFGILYGMGVKNMSKKLNLTYEDGLGLVNEYKGLFYGLKDLQNRFKEDAGVLTWGGRWYDVEKPRMCTVARSVGHSIIYTEEVEQDYYYKLLNYAVQGSAAEVTKQAIINIDRVISKDTTFYLTVHDEVLVSAPKDIEKQEMKAMDEAMQDVNFNGIKMVSDGKRSARNWASMRSVK